MTSGPSFAPEYAATALDAATRAPSFAARGGSQRARRRLPGAILRRARSGDACRPEAEAPDFPTAKKEIPL